jgi:NADH dehydrogenase
MTEQIVVLGGGFAGLWSALGAARQRNELGIAADQLEITLVNRDAWHSIRVRNYEADLAGVRVPLKTVLDPVGIRQVKGEVVSLNLTDQAVLVNTTSGPQSLAYDRLVFALGSELRRPAIPGLDQYALDVDTYAGAERLQEHLRGLSTHSHSPGRFTVLVIGAGLTGIEVTTEMPDRLRALLASSENIPFRVILADHHSRIGSDMGEEAIPVIQTALDALGVETRTGVEIVSVDATGVRLRSGEAIEEIAAETVIWCAGMQANPLTRSFPVERDRFGRLPVDTYLRVQGVPNVFAAGDSAWMLMDRQHCSVMSCQHGRPMGRFAGHNMVCDLMGLPMLPLEIEWYVTVLDLGAWGALYTEGWDRHVVTTGMAAKQTKQVINRERIYPPLSGDPAALLAAAAPIVQSPPARQH